MVPAIACRAEEGPGKGASVEGGGYRELTVSHQEVHKAQVVQGV